MARGSDAGLAAVEEKDVARSVGLVDIDHRWDSALRFPCDVSYRDGDDSVDPTWDQAPDGPFGSRGRVAGVADDDERSLFVGHVLDTSDQRQIERIETGDQHRDGVRPARERGRGHASRKDDGADAVTCAHEPVRLEL